jgi:alpha-glucosidase
MTAPELSATPRASQRRALREWRRDALINKNHLPSLRDGSGDGIGDLEGLTQCLDYLAGTLGVTAIWVRPSPGSPLHDQGLDITGHTDVEPVFGSIETVDRDALAAYAVETRAVTR